MNKIKNLFTIAAKGMLMGIVETVPGVSGSTVALITGIYERFIFALKNINIKALKLLIRGRFSDFWLHIDGNFLSILFLGMIIGVVISIFTVSKLLSSNPQELWAFFFGLVLATGVFLSFDYIYRPFRKILKKSRVEDDIENKKKNTNSNNFLSNESLFSDKKEQKELEKNRREKSLVYKSKKITENNYFEVIKNIIFLSMGFLAIFCLTNCISIPPSNSLWLIFFSGVFAFSAFLLPGISGSFVLLILGVYSTIIPTLKNFISSPNSQDFIIIAIFSLGMIVGLFSFSRIFNYIFKKWKNSSMSLIVGIIFGSLFKLWPWKIEEKILTDNGKIIDLLTVNEIPDNYKVISEVNFLPELSTDTLFIFLFFILGIVALVVLRHFQK